MRVVDGALVSEDSHPGQTPAVATNTSGQRLKLKEISASLGDSGSLDTSQSGEDVVGASEAGVRESLWQMSWTAVSLAVHFDVTEGTGSDLALHLCSQLKDLYGGGLEGEFRYSENVKNLLEMVCVLARPRCGAVSRLAANSVSSNSGTATSTLTSRTRRSLAGDVQLQRGILSLLMEIRPVDLISTRCFVSTLAELCNAIHSTRVDFLPSETRVTSDESRQADGGRTILLLLPVEDRLRNDSGEFLIQILEHSIAQVQPEGNNKKSKEESTEGEEEKVHPVATIRGVAAWTACVDIVSARFTVDLCEGLIGARKSSNNPPPSDSQAIATEASSPPINSVSGNSSVGGFLNSIGKMLSSNTKNISSGAGGAGAVVSPRLSLGAGAEVVTAAQEKDGKERPPPAPHSRSQSFQGRCTGVLSPASSFRLVASGGVGLQLHSLVHIPHPHNAAAASLPPTPATTPSTMPPSPGTARKLSCDNSAEPALTRWSVLPCPKVSLKLLSSVYRLCLSNIPNKVSDAQWGQILIPVACVLSPWLVTEIHDSLISEGGYEYLGLSVTRQSSGTFGTSAGSEYAGGTTEGNEKPSNESTEQSPLSTLAEVLTRFAITQRYVAFGFFLVTCMHLFPQHAFVANSSFNS